MGRRGAPWIRGWKRELRQTPLRQVGSSELKRNYRDGGVKGTI